MRIRTRDGCNALFLLKQYLNPCRAIRPIRIDLRNIPLQQRPIRIELRNIPLQQRPIRIDLRNIPLQQRPIRIDLRTFPLQQRPASCCSIRSNGRCLGPFLMSYDPS